MKLEFVATMLLATLPVGSGHAVLMEPKSRQFVACKTCLGGVGCPASPDACLKTYPKGCREYNAANFQAGGPGMTYDRGGGKWPTPVGAHGLCGDPEQNQGMISYEKEAYMLETPPQMTYTAGQIVKFKIGISTEHQGFYSFRICDKVLNRANFKNHQEGDDCLKKWQLKRVDSGSDSQPIDVRHPERWYVGVNGGGNKAAGAAGFHAFANGTQSVAGEDWDDSMKSQSHDFSHAFKIPEEDYVNAQGECTWCNCQVTSGTTTTDTFQIPEDLECEACTLQWWWVSGNRCTYDADFTTYLKGVDDPGKNKLSPVCGGSSGASHGEEFWNCADIAVKPSANAPRRRTASPPRRRAPSTRRRRRKSSAPRRRRRRTSSRRRKSTRRRRKSSRRRK